MKENGDRSSFFRKRGQVQFFWNPHPSFEQKNWTCPRFLKCPCFLKKLDLSPFSPPALIVGLWLFFFWPVITGNRQLAYRDSASHYFPLFHWIDSQWRAGSIPLWNSLENLGQPVVADGSSTVFYPGKVVFWVPCLSYPARFGIFVSAHILLACLGAFWCACVFGCHRWGAALTAISYGFGGPVLFQTCNVVYLIGAAWAPVAIGCLWRYKQTALRKNLLGVCVVSALIILGGDPQMAYHLLMISAFVVGCLQIGTRKPGWRRRAFNLLMLLGVPLALGAVQVIPTAQWSSRSERNAYVFPRTVFEACQQLGTGGDRESITLGLFGPPVKNTHHDDLYQFSQPPWSVVELILPNASGKMFPNYRRWTDALSSADRVWVASLFVGLLTFLLACLQLRFWGRDGPSRFLTLISILFLVGSFGWYGLGYAVNEFALLTGGAGVSSVLGAPVGGVYWFMVICLPFYVGFRYPAKLTVLFSLGVALLAGRSLSRWSRRKVFRLAGLLVLVVAVDCVIVASVLNLVPTLTHQSDPVFGAFDLLGFRHDLFACCSHVMFVAVTALVLCWLLLARRVKRATLRRFIVVTTAAELLVAGWWMVPTASVSESIDPPKAEAARSSNAPLQRAARFAIDAGYPGQDSLSDLACHLDRSADDRFSLHIQWQRNSHYPKLHLLDDLAIVGSYSSLAPLDYSIWTLVASSFESESSRTELPTWLLDMLAVTRRVEYDYNVVADERRYRVQSISRQENSELDEARLVFDYSVLPPINERDFQQVIDRTTYVLHSLQKSRGGSVLVETDTVSQLDQRGLPAASSGSITKFLRVNDQRIEIELESSGCLLVLSDYWDPDWRAYVRPAGEAVWKSNPILRVNRILRGVVVPAGGVEVLMVYRPIGFYAGAAISLVAWFALFVGFVIARRRRNGDRSNY